MDNNYFWPDGRVKYLTVSKAVKRRPMAIMVGRPDGRKTSFSIASDSVYLNVPEQYRRAVEFLADDMKVSNDVRQQMHDAYNIFLAYYGIKLRKVTVWILDKE